MTISTLLRKGMETNLSNRALFDDEASLTYRELLALADQIAGALQAKGAAVGDLAAIVLPKSMDYIAAEVACVLYGYGAVLLDAAYPKDRVEYCVENSGAEYVIDAGFLREARNCTTVPEKGDVREDTPAIAIYTSGSTGKPKGVLHDQESIAGLIDRITDFTNPVPTDVVGTVAPFTFVASCGELLKSLCAGTSITIVPREVLMNPPMLSEYIEKNQITNMYMPPKLLKLFQQKGNSLKNISTGSERVSGIAPEGYSVTVMYGMTETAASVCGFRIDKAYDNTPVGKPLKGCSVYLLNDKNEECEEGEICVAGHFMTGYIGMPEKTAETKVNNPFFEQDGHEYMIRTNDIGRRLPDGNILFVNRKDWMIKINGQRVEPGEIEHVIKQVKGVRDAAVKGFERGGRAFVCGFYVATDEVTEQEIRGAIADKLPPYMMPENLVRMDAFPLNANGKLDRMALKAPAIATACVAPETKEEETALAIAKTLIEDIEFGVTDDLDVLGMDSMKSMEFSVGLKDAGIDVTTSAVMKYRNIRDILTGGNDMMWFVGEYDASKPILVAVSGIVVLRPVIPFYQAMNEKYNVLLIEPVQDHYEKRLQSLKYDTLIETYLEQIMRIVPDSRHIIGFMGFSFGGELAASLADRFREVTGQERFALLGDTVVKAPGEYLNRKLTKEDLPRDVTLGMKEKIDSFVYRADIVNSFGFGEKYACYNGPVTLIDAKQGYTEDREEKKLVNAAARYANLTVIPMEECTHSDLFRNMDLLPFYQSIIDAYYKEKEERR